MPRFLLLLLVTLPMTGALLAGELALPLAVVEAGGMLTIPLRLNEGQSRLTALQFDLQFDEASLEMSAQPGQAASDAGKALSTARVGANRIRFLLAGLNQEAVRDGKVVLLTIRVGRNLAPGVKLDLRISKAVGSTGEAKSLELSAVDGAITIVADR